MVFVYAFQSPGCDLDGETFEVNALTREEADRRAAARLKDTFSWATEERRAVTSVRFIDVVKLAKRHRHNFEDGDVCSTCDALRSA